MKSLSYGIMEMTDIDKHDEYFAIDNGCAECAYRAAKIATTDVLSAIISNELTQTEKTAVNLYWFRNMHLSEIAQLSGVSITSIRKTLDRAEKKIYTIMKYIVLYNEMTDGKKLPSDSFEIRIIRNKDGKELLAG